MEYGRHLNVYHIGSTEETSIQDLARAVARNLGCKITLVPGELTPGSTLRRCPDIRKLKALGFAPQVSLDEGLARTIPSYLAD